jgi:regulator of PEP synthase PpsR (kinase-PPPase family)
MIGMDHEPRFIDVLSDSTGETAERVMRAALLQFPQSGVEIRRHVRVRTKKRAEPILRGAAADGALLVFSVVSPELSQFIHQQILDLGIEAIDVIGSVIDRLESYLERKAINRPGALLPLGKEYFRRIEAVEFTVRSDAGRDPRNFLKADLVLVGVSRTSKTPLATLLAHRGLKVANLTLALNAQPPAELERTPQDRIVGLTIDVDSLCAIRQERLRKLGMPQESQYGVRTQVGREIAYAEKVFADNPDWPVVDMTGRSVEETAGIVLELMSTRLARPRSRASDLAPKPQGWPAG